MKNAEAEFTVARVKIQKMVWRKLKAKASLFGKPVSVYVAQILEKEAMENEKERQ